ncbi:hypothetical protein BES34_007510 [Leptospira inadai serovar Lyme]|uniref:Uncharacterized protein n=1 Tax=Leptospira inadai serovar Lyme TaxID=293084 RepID=A0ABX4YK07_9LEPT|nr:hypothetical protein BES34_007510 [Leptospira inadai serovar Lyme]
MIPEPNETGSRYKIEQIEPLFMLVKSHSIEIFLGILKRPVKDHLEYSLARQDNHLFLHVADQRKRRIKKGSERES